MLKSLFLDYNIINFPLPIPPLKLSHTPLHALLQTQGLFFHMYILYMYIYISKYHLLSMMILKALPEKKTLLNWTGKNIYWTK